MPKILNRVGTLTISLLVNYVNQERALNTICKNRFLALSSLKTNSMPYEKKNIETPKVTIYQFAPVQSYRYF